MNRNINRLLCRVAEEALVTLVVSLFSRVGDSLGGKLDEKISEKKQVVE